VLKSVAAGEASSMSDGWVSGRSLLVVVIVQLSKATTRVVIRLRFPARPAAFAEPTLGAQRQQRLHRYILKDISAARETLVAPTLYVRIICHLLRSQQSQTSFQTPVYFVGACPVAVPGRRGWDGCIAFWAARSGLGSCLVTLRCGTRG